MSERQTKNRRDFLQRAQAKLDANPAGRIPWALRTREQKKSLVRDAMAVRRWECAPKDWPAERAQFEEVLRRLDIDPASLVPDDTGALEEGLASTGKSEGTSAMLDAQLPPELAGYGAALIGGPNIAAYDPIDVEETLEQRAEMDAALERVNGRPTL